MPEEITVQSVKAAIAVLNKDSETIKRYQGALDAFRAANEAFNIEAERYKKETGGNLLEAGTPLADSKIAIFYDIKSLGMDGLEDQEVYDFWSGCKSSWGNSIPSDPRLKKTKAGKMESWDDEGIMKDILLPAFTEAMKSLGKDSSQEDIRKAAANLVKEEDLQKCFSNFRSTRQEIVNGKSKTVETKSAKDRILAESGQPRVWNQMLNVMVKHDIATRTNILKGTKKKDSNGKMVAQKGAKWEYSLFE